LLIFCAKPCSFVDIDLMTVMKKTSYLPLTLIFTFISICGLAQTTGDYRSNAAAFNWNTDASWQRWDGGAWVVPTAAQGYPGETAASIAGTVTIQTGHTVTANVDVTTNDIGNLTLEGSGILSISNNIDIDATGTVTMNGTSQIQGGGTSRTLDAAALNIPATTTNAIITNIRLTTTGAATVAGTLTMSSTTATINGATTVTGTLTLSSDTGTKTFNGTVTVSASGTWTSTAITSGGRLVFGGEILTSGVFNPGCQ
jgi:hypothetical protein